jgi:hypothetical protein
MTFDHVGVVFFGGVAIFRILGRLAFPLFAYFIAEGCKYTQNKLKRFLTVFIIGTLYTVFFLIYDGELYLNIFVTFSISIILIYLLQWAKSLVFNDGKLIFAIIPVILIAALITGTSFLEKHIYLEYGVRGSILPLLISLFDFRGINKLPVWATKLDNHFMSLICMSVGLSLLCINANLGQLQLYSFISVLLLLFYNGSVGNRKMKYAFYIFYPAHLVIIEGLSLLISIL